MLSYHPLQSKRVIIYTLILRNVLEHFVQTVLLFKFEPKHNHSIYMTTMCIRAKRTPCYHWKRDLAIDSEAGSDAYPPEEHLNHRDSHCCITTDVFMHV